VDNDDPATGPSPADPPSAAGTQALDFDKAAYAEPTQARTCAACKQDIASEYFEVSGQIICTPCRNQLAGALPDRWAFPRALLYGGLVGAAGTVVWSLIIHFTGYELGLIAILVGIGVGIAVRKGSHGRGGWKYQLLAMLLTYVSITTSYVPIILKGVLKGARDSASMTATQDKADSAKIVTRTASSPSEAPGESSPAAKSPTEHGGLPLPMALLAFVALVWGWALAAPFLAGASNIMGLIIIAIGLYEAWKYNRRVPVHGPFKLAPPAENAATPSP
jgi:hypothetical protein